MHQHLAGERHLRRSRGFGLEEVAMSRDRKLLLVKATSCIVVRTGCQPPGEIVLQQQQQQDLKLACLGNEEEEDKDEVEDEEDERGDVEQDERDQQMKPGQVKANCR